MGDEQAPGTRRRNRRDCFSAGRLRHTEGTAHREEPLDQQLLPLRAIAFQAGHAGSIPVTRSTAMHAFMLPGGPRQVPMACAVDGISRIVNGGRKLNP
jgi:hypothetical protein